MKNLMIKLLINVIGGGNFLGSAHRLTTLASDCRLQRAALLVALMLTTLPLFLTACSEDSPQDLPNDFTDTRALADSTEAGTINMPVDTVWPDTIYQNFDDAIPTDINTNGDQPEGDAQHAASRR